MCQFVYGVFGRSNLTRRVGLCNQCLFHSDRMIDKVGLNISLDGTGHLFWKSPCASDTRHSLVPKEVNSAFTFIEGL